MVSAIAAKKCTDCGRSVGFLSRLTDRQRCRVCEQKAEQRQEEEHRLAKERHTELVRQYRSTLDDLWRASANGAVSDAIIPASPLAASDTRLAIASALSDFTDELLQDEMLTEEEEARLLGIAKTLGFDQQDLDRHLSRMGRRLKIARINAGRLPTIPATAILLKRGEEARAQVEANLLKEQITREFQAGSVGVSFRVMKGVRFHTGSIRGRSVVVGTETVRETTGTLTVTSQRIAFSSPKRSADIPYAKLLALDPYQNAIRIHAANRKNPLLFEVDDGLYLTALVNAAARMAR